MELRMQLASKAVYAKKRRRDSIPMAIESRGYPRMTVTQKAERSIKNGHPWVYGGEVVQIDGEPQDGGLADVLSPKGSYLGTGLVNRHSKILVRLLSRNANDRFDEGFFRRRIAYALDYRQAVMGTDFACCRLIFGEADQLPGLTVDRFSDILVTQILSLGMEQRKPLLFRLLVEEMEKRGARPRAIYERNDVAIRELEGMEQGKGFVEMDGLETELSGHVEICENGVYYDVDYMEGQKTGFFLDQKYNRQAVARLAKGRRVLDCFTHTGAFALNAAKGGAAQVTAVDISASAIDLCKANAARNGIEGMAFLVADVFALLEEMGGQKKSPYDFIILDPPAFTKTRAAVASAARGYKEINLRAMKLLRDGGYLITCSCSQHILPQMFQGIVQSAAADTHTHLQQVEFRTQGRDHPILPALPETQYLKCGIYRVER